MTPGKETSKNKFPCLQIPKVTGKWVDHPSSNHLGYYDPRNDCPSYAEDFNCLRPYPPAEINEELAAKEYRKVSAPAELTCDCIGHCRGMWACLTCGHHPAHACGADIILTELRQVHGRVGRALSAAQVFLADQCQLRHFDAAGFEACMTGRRLFLIGADLRSSPAHPLILCMLCSHPYQNLPPLYGVALCLICQAAGTRACCMGRSLQSFI